MLWRLPLIDCRRIGGWYPHPQVTSTLASAKFHRIYSGLATHRQGSTECGRTAYGAAILIPYRVGSNVSKFDAILSSCPDEKMKVEVKRNLQVWDTKNPRNLEKFLELIALVCNDRELRSSMESVFSSSRSWVGHASSSSIRSAPKMVDPNQAKENIKAILGTPRVRENSVAESSSTFLSGSLREPSHNDVVDTVRAIPRSKKFGTIGRLPIEVQESIAGYIRKTIYEFRFLVDQLDDERRSRGLKLLAIWAGVQDAVLNFDVLARIARTIMSIDLRSGALLSFLRRGDFSAFSDGKVQRMMTFVQNRAYAPFLHMLECWIYRGMLDDPYEEFFVVRNQEFATENVSAYYSEDYWTGAYGVPVTEMVPDFLQGQLALQVLNTGKYINVIKKSGHTFRCPFEAPIPFSDSDKPTVEAVKKAHAYASNALMKVLIDEHDLLGILGAIKHYFLMDKADFIEEFMLLCDNVELGGCIGDVNLTRLNTLLELALRISIGENEVYKDYLKGSLKQYGLEAELCKIVSISTKQEHEWDENMKSMSVPVWEAFTLTYDVQWPISLVIELRSMTCYQMLFRHFFHLKRVVRLLTRLRISPRPRKMTRTGQSGLVRALYGLRLKMVHLVQTLQHCMIFDVVEPAWREMMTRIGQAVAMDQVITMHKDFIDACLKDCMLTYPRVLQILRGIFNVCMEFCNLVEKSAGIDGVKFDKNEELRVEKLDVAFSTLALELINLASDDAGVISATVKNMLRRLNYNAHYSDVQ
ncbi:unnamed protein product [Notodromas monacha]|uniref:Gamma-tubulin complex component n=1 Tax=Notodromas monacha TaxID=399045 RepID=A0A7R9GJF4_9CRUS|nr:unnamed protein product [Notodromas monacha]CAG0923498.1 unnamed protein product [Notodromas monacha]